MWLDLLVRLIGFVIVCYVVYFVITWIAVKTKFDETFTKVILWVLGGIAIIWFLLKIVQPAL